VAGHRILASQQVESRGSSGLFVYIDDLEGHPIDCADVLVPPTVIEEGTADEIQKLTYHQLEMIWNASGVAMHLINGSKMTIELQMLALSAATAWYKSS
jgi:hypothetical protein